MSLRVLAWDHPRATLPLAACARTWRAETGEEVVVETRSLTAFGDETPLPGRSDLVLIDHPHVGQAASTGSILALDELIGPQRLAGLDAGSVDPPRVYAWGGAHWAVAIDSACQALAVNDSALGGRSAPLTWGEVLVLASELPGQVALPLQPAHAISSLLSLLAARGEQAGGAVLSSREALEWAIATLASLARQGPREAFAWEPPEALARLANGELACVPLTYAYVGYPVAWHDAPSAEPGGPPGAILGGVGVAVLASSEQPAAAANLAAWLASATVQRDIVLPAGGQPASRAAWDDPAAEPMFRAIRRTIGASRVRPREPWWPAFQRASGELLARGLLARTDSAVVADELEQTYRQHRSQTT